MEAVGGHVDIPRRYLSDRGQMLEGAPFSERDIRAPADAAGRGRPRRAGARPPRAAVSPVTCTATTPSTSSAGTAALYPWALSIHDFEPIVGTIHQPPPVHQTFEGPGFVVCSFVPRLFDSDPDAVKVPYHHANVDSDEVLFYSDGDFMSRAGSGIGVGSISFHPAGFVHGPQPGSLERSLDQDRTEELAVMIDTFRALRVTGAARSVSAPDYHLSWAR